MRTPYGRGGERATTRADAFAKAGYVAVWVDVRGRGDSEGAFEPYRNDGLDGVDVIAWAAAQEWCDGAVATFGGSYPGRIQWLTALHRATRTGGDDRARNAIRSVRREPDRRAGADAHPLVPDDRWSRAPVHRVRRLDERLCPPPADRARRGRGLSLPDVARGVPPPDARRMVGAGPISAPDRRGRRPDPAHLGLV